MEYNDNNAILRRPRFTGLKLSEFEKLVLEQSYLYHFQIKGRNSFTTTVKERKFLCTFTSSKYTQLNTQFVLLTLYFRTELIPYNFKLQRTDNKFSFTPAKV